MNLLKRLSRTVRGRKISVRVPRLLVPLVLAFIVFGMSGFASSSHNTAHASSCTNVVRDSQTIIGYFGTYLGTVKLIKNSCTGLFHGQIVCSQIGPADLSLTNLGTFTTYDTISKSCTTIGQVIENAPHAYVQGNFCAEADIIKTDGSDGGSAFACYNQP